MRAARVVTTLVLTAHGSADPRSAANARAVANRIRFMRPGLRVRVAFCELNTPRLADVLTPDCGRHTVPAGRRLSRTHRHSAADRELRRARATGRRARRGRPVGVRAARAAGRAGSRHAGSGARRAGRRDRFDTCRGERPDRAVADKLSAGNQWAGTTTAFATGNGPSPAEAVDWLRRSGARRVVIAPWFLAPGRLTDRVAQFAAAEGIPMAAPLGGHRLVAETVLDRFDAAIARRIAA